MDAGVEEQIGKDALLADLDEKRREKALGLPESELTMRLEESKKVRVRQCGIALEEVLKQYNCSMTTEVVIRGSQFSSQVILIAK